MNGNVNLSLLKWIGTGKGWKIKVKKIACLVEVYWFLWEKLGWIIEELFAAIGKEISEISFWGTESFL